MSRSVTDETFFFTIVIAGLPPVVVIIIKSPVPKTIIIIPIIIVVALYPTVVRQVSNFSTVVAGTSFPLVIAPIIIIIIITKSPVISLGCGQLLKSLGELSDCCFYVLEFIIVLTQVIAP